MAALDGNLEPGPGVAIFPWGEVIEKFLDSLDLDLDDFVTKMTGGWLFGYVLALQRHGWRPVIVCASERVAKPTRLTHAGTGAPVWAVPGRRATRLSGASLHAIEQWLKSPMQDFADVLCQERCAAVVAQEYEYFRFDQLARLGTRLRCPVYATFQGGDVTLSAIERLVRPRSLSLCSGLIVASARERARLTRAYPRLMAAVADIPNPLDCDEWRPVNRALARAELGLPAEAFIVVNHGRTDIGRKGLDVLLEAWTQFAGMRPDAHAFLIGSGQDHAAFLQMLQDRAPDRLTWISSYITDRPRVRQWLSTADAYLITSRTEGMPVAPLEAMACGLPVISSDAHGLPDIFAAGEQHGGIVTPREDVNALVAALERLAGQPDLRARLGRAARRRVEEHFSIPAVGAALSSFLRANAPLSR